MPSIIDTPSNRAAMPTADYAKWPRADQIAEVISFLMSDAAELVSGAAIPVYGRA
jgi:NAD(P)-dependent dehydrogenase (short-subunit alcohol dehydrogenase family)